MKQKVTTSTLGELIQEFGYGLNLTVFLQQVKHLPAGVHQAQPGIIQKCVCGVYRWRQESHDCNQRLQEKKTVHSHSSPGSANQQTSDFGEVTEPNVNLVLLHLQNRHLPPPKTGVKTRCSLPKRSTQCERLQILYASIYRQFSTHQQVLFLIFQTKQFCPLVKQQVLRK